MSVVPENAALCTCWRDATPEERERDGVGQGQFRPSAIRSCPRCKGAGWYMADELKPVTHVAANDVLIGGRRLRQRCAWEGGLWLSDHAHLSLHVVKAESTAWRPDPDRVGWQVLRSFADLLRAPNGRDGEWHAVIHLPHEVVEQDGYGVPLFEGDTERIEWERRRRERRGR